MLSRSAIEKIKGKVSEPNFWKLPCQGNDWKAEYMRIIPEEFVRSTKIECRVVSSVSWGNSWQFWIERGKSGMVILKEDWDEFVDTNLLGPDDILVFEHEDTMFLQLRIFKKDGEEVVTAPELETELETEPVDLTSQNSRQETFPAFSSETEPVHLAPQISCQETFPAFASASRARGDCGDVDNPEQYLLNPNSPYFVKTLTKKNDVLYVPGKPIRKYGLKFAPMNTAMSYIISGVKEEGFTKLYSSGPCFNGWTALCRKYNLKTGDSVVCELELSGGVVAIVRLHLVNK